MGREKKVEKAMAVDAAKFWWGGDKLKKIWARPGPEKLVGPPTANTDYLSSTKSTRSAWSFRCLIFSSPGLPFCSGTP